MNLETLRDKVQGMSRQELIQALNKLDEISESPAPVKGRCLPARFLHASYIDTDTGRTGEIVRITRTRVFVQYPEMGGPVCQEPVKPNILLWIRGDRYA